MFLRLLTLVAICEARLQYSYVTAVPSHPPSIEISATQSMQAQAQPRQAQPRQAQQTNITASYVYGTEERAGVFLGIGTLVLVILVLQILEYRLTNRNKKGSILPVYVKVNTFDVSTSGPMDSVSGQSIVYVKRYSPILK